MFGLNRRISSIVQPQVFNRQLPVQLRNRIVAIAFGEESNRKLFECPHLGTLSKDQTMVLKPKDVKIDAPIKTVATEPNVKEELENPFTKFMLHLQKYSEKNEEFKDASTREQFLTVLKRSCADVQSIDFCNFELPDGFFVELVQCCPELECIKMDQPVVNEDDWDRGLKQVGQKIIHFEISPCGVLEDDAMLSVIQKVSRLVSSIAANCPNIKQLNVTLDWMMGWTLTGELMLAFKKLPKSCFVTFQCKKLTDKEVKKNSQLFEDVIDDLLVHTLDWCLLKRRYTKAKRIIFYEMEHCDGHAVDFSGLQALDLISSMSNEAMNCLIASRFPQLVELRVNASGMTENNYNGLFQKTTSIRMLTIQYDYIDNQASQLPRSAVKHLNKVELIIIHIVKVGSYWQPKTFLKQVEQYVDDVRTLKELIVDPRGLVEESGKWMKPVLNKVNQLKQKQSRVEVHAYLGEDDEDEDE